MPEGQARDNRYLDLHHHPMNQKTSESIFDHFFVARQPIFLEHGKIWGYELLFRGGPEVNQANIVDADLATFIVSTCGFIRTQEDLDQSKKVCINFTERALFDGAPRGLPPTVTVIEVLENIQPSERLIEALIGYKQEGYLIAADDFEGNADIHEILELADIIKVDLLHKSIDDIRRICDVLGANKALKIAEKVDNREIIPVLKELGFTLYQGYFFAKPEILTGRTINSTQVSKLRILQVIEDPAADTAIIEKVVMSDPSITYRLLRFLNTAAFGFSRKIDTIRHAIVLLGLNRIKSWLRMVILSDLIGKKTPELYSMALVRGRLLEELFKEDQIRIKNAEIMFLFGMLSLIEPMLEMPLEVILEHLPLSEDLKAGYLQPDSLFNRYLQLLVALEYADTDRITHLSRTLGIDERKLAEASVRSIAWANQICSFIL